MRMRELPRAGLAGIRPSELTPRALGPHVTDITGYTMAKIDPERYAPFDGSAASIARRDAYFSAGFLWEEWLTSLFAQRHTYQSPNFLYHGRPGEYSRDGISGNPDGLVTATDDDVLALAESKFTWKSRRDFDLDTKKFLGWKLQVMSYLYMLELTRVYFVVFWVNGRYEKYIPELYEYQVDFSERELQDHWATMLNWGRQMGVLPA